MPITLKLEINRPTSLPNIVKGHILDLIRQGVVKDGDRLPPEEEIARQNNISRGTVRTAMAELAREGLVKRYAKRGTFIHFRPASTTIRIGVISPLLPMTKEETDSYRTELWGGIQEGVLETGASLHFSQTIPDKPAHMESAFGIKIDGLLFLIPLRNQSNLIASLCTSAAPLVVIGGRAHKNINSIGVNNIRGIQSALDHLYRNGHRKIAAIFSSLEYFDQFERHRAFISGLKSFSLPYRKEWIKLIPEVSSRRWVEDAEQAAKGIFSGRSAPTALLCSGGFITIGAKAGLRKLNLAIPEDVSLIGFDDIYLAEYMDPPLTTISQPVWEMGKEAVKALVAIIRNKTYQPYHTTINTKLMLRRSVKNLNTGEEAS